MGETDRHTDNAIAEQFVPLRFQGKILEAIADPPGKSEKGAPKLRNKDVNKESAKRADI